ncbi:MAG: fasciclin domain-containing protein [Proteobacteria bacterium]|nr:fasciclin domain-containing protein [Pseudomonadota bacterium]
MYQANNRFLLTLLGVAFFLSASAGYARQSYVVGSDEQDKCHQIKKGTIVEIAKASGKFTILLKALEKTGLMESIDQAQGPLTLFAPTDDAFNQLAQSEMEALMNDKELLKDVLLYHVVEGRLTVKEATSREVVQSAEGDDLFFFRDEKGYGVNEANIICADIEASNGIVHVIDYVLFPMVK